MSSLRFLAASIKSKYVGRDPHFEQIHILFPSTSCRRFLVMFRFAALISLLITASAFVSTGRVASSTALKMQFEDALGAQPPLGFWYENDPFMRHLYNFGRLIYHYLFKIII